MVGIVAVVVGLSGCGDATQVARQQETSHLRALVSLYTFAARTERRPPASEAEFRKFVASNGGPMLEKLQIAGIDELLISERDGQPLVVIYGKRPQGVSPEVVAYEQIGVDGKRQVGLTLGSIEEVDEQRFRQLVPAGVAAP